MNSSRAIESKVKKIEGSPIRQCWQIKSNSSEPSVHRVLPSAYLHIVTPLKGKIHIEGIPAPLHEPFIAPILSCFKKIEIEPGAIIFGMHLHPAYGSMIFGGSPGGMMRNAHLIKTIFNKRIKSSFTDAMMISQSFEQRVRAIVSLFDTMSHGKEIQKRQSINFYLSCIRENPQLSMKEISEKMGYSTRWIEILHKELTGISPKEMTRIVRFNKFILSLHQEQTATAGLALDSGYYDQAHAIREFKRLGGLTPGTFSKIQPSLSRILNSF